MVGQPLGRALDLEHLDGLGRLGVGVRRLELVLVDGLPELAHGVLVQRGEGRLLGGVVEQEEAPVLLVAARGGPDGRIEDAGLDVVGDGVRPDAAHGAGRVQRFVEIHGGDLTSPGGSVQGLRPREMTQRAVGGLADWPRQADVRIDVDVLTGVVRRAVGPGRRDPDVARPSRTR